MRDRLLWVLAVGVAAPAIAAALVIAAVHELHHHTGQPVSLDDDLDG